MPRAQQGDRGGGFIHHVPGRDFHRLNGDRPLGHTGRLAYFPLNWLNNRFPEWRVDSRLAIRDFEVLFWRTSHRPLN